MVTVVEDDVEFNKYPVKYDFEVPAESLFAQRIRRDLLEEIAE